VFRGFAGAASIVSHIHIILISLWYESDTDRWAVTAGKIAVD
jgi:hypothetical protein